MPTYDLWFHEHLGWFAARLEAGRVTGIHRPILDATALDYDPSVFVYDESPEAVQRAPETAEQYVAAGARG